jgi:two-component system, chemotaxis family, chemotaxis protein CheY
VSEGERLKSDHVGNGRIMGVKVLVIDDSATIRVQVRRALCAEGFTVIEATDGVDALEKFDATPDTRLVVCDVNMPRMNGLEFLDVVRNDRGSSVAVLMLTTDSQVELIQRAKVLGAKGWLIKPVRTELLVAAAKKLTAA